MQSEPVKGAATSPTSGISLWLWMQVVRCRQDDGRECARGMNSSGLSPIIIPDMPALSTTEIVYDWISRLLSFRGPLPRNDSYVWWLHSVLSVYSWARNPSLWDKMTGAWLACRGTRHPEHRRTLNIYRSEHVTIISKVARLGFCTTPIGHLMYLELGTYNLEIRGDKSQSTTEQLVISISVFTGLCLILCDV